MSFLKAEWRKLAIASYIIEQDLLAKYVPAGTELDLWNGNCFISMVGFMFVNTSLLGFKIPLHRNFEEVNLRFYVKRFENGEWKRGVVFIKEIVPKPALTLVANAVYNENYETLPMKHLWSSDSDQRTILYKWKKNNKWHSLKIESSINKLNIEPNSEAEFITEHYWGFTKVNKKKSYEYEVLHPKWEMYNVINYKIDVDFGAVYGSEFEFLNSINPISVMLAEGSEISVEHKKTINIGNKFL